MSDLKWTTGTDPANLGAPAPRRCRRHSWWSLPSDASESMREHWGDKSKCLRCGTERNAAASRRGRTNRSRGNRAELTIAREIPGAKKMGPLGLPWDVEVGSYARLQVKKLVSRPSANAIRKLIEAIPNTGDRLRGFVWVEAAGRGKRGRREVWFDVGEFAQRHGIGKAAGWATSFGNLVTLPLADWIETFVGVETQP